jgi:hypothetical protein
MIRKSLPQVGRAAFRQQNAKMSGGLPHALYNNVWKKSNVSYLTYIVVGCVVVEAVYGSVTNYIWDTYNYGVSDCELALR